MHSGAGHALTRMAHVVSAYLRVHVNAQHRQGVDCQLSAAASLAASLTAARGGCISISRLGCCRIPTGDAGVAGERGARGDARSLDTGTNFT